MIFWFSGTGNSKYVAQRLARETNDEARAMPDLMRAARPARPLLEGERLGFVFPVYFYGLPSVVNEFIAGIRQHCAPDTYVYAVLTCGGSIARADDLLRAALQKKRVPLTAVFALKMPDNYILMYDLPPQIDVDARLAQADEALEEIIGRVKARATGAEIRLRGALAHAKSALVYPLYDLARRTRPFFATDQCAFCGACAAACPTGCIEVNGGKPVWTKPACALCLACLHRCPRGAIQYGGKTKARRRYAHPQSGWQPKEKEEACSREN